MPVVCFALYLKASVEPENRASYTTIIGGKRVVAGVRQRLMAGG